MDANSNTQFTLDKRIIKGIPTYELCLFTKGIQQSLRITGTPYTAVCTHDSGEPSANGFTESKYISLEDGVDILERYFADLIKSMREDVQKVKSVSHGN